uniref:BHLH domain-containing protein n=1 Tax=Mola mola TaxID=94237 RepID=A0A3Q3VSS3_MOLML
MVGRQTLRMDAGHCSGALVDDSPASSPSSSPSPDGRRRELQRARALQPGALGALGGRGRPAAANAARERSRVQTLRTAFLELQRTLPSVPPDTKLSKLDVLILATTYIAHLTRTLQEEGAEEGESTKQTQALHSLKGDGYLHPVKKWPMRSRLYVGATGQFLHTSDPAESENQGPSSSTSQ